MSRPTLRYFATYHRSPESPSAPAGAKVNLSDENVNFLPLNPVRELKRIVDDGNLEVRRLQYSYNLDADDSETLQLKLAASPLTRGKWDEKTISTYYRQRHYDPNPAQFVSEDPLGFGGGDKNLYGYVGNSPVNYTDPTGLIAEGFLDTLGNQLEGAAYSVAGFIVRNVHEPVGRSLADNHALESALRTGDSIAVGVAQTGNFVGFDIREFREDIYGEEVNDNLNETIVTISTTGTLVLGGFALSGFAAGSAAFNATATAAINVGLINAGIGLTTQLLTNGGDSSELDYDSLRLDFAFGTLGSFVGAGVAAKTGGGLVSRIGFSTAFEGAFAGTEQVVRNLANGGSWSQDVRSAILSSILLQGGSEILSNSREVLQAGGRLLRAGGKRVDDVLGALDGRRLATPDGVGDGRLLRSVDEVPNVPKGGNNFAASTDGGGGGVINSIDEARKIQQRLNALSIQGNKVRGFRNAGELIERVGNLRNRLNNLGVSDAQVGIRGSSVTNQSSKGGFFRFFSTNAGKKSDIDFFIASPSLEKKLDQFFTSSGVIKPDDLKRVDPELGDILSIFGQETRKQVGRKTSVGLLRKSLVEQLYPSEFVIF